VPELPDIVTYLDGLRARILAQPLERVRIASPFLLRSVDPPLSAFVSQKVRTVSRIGKRIVIGFDDELYLVLHLMIAGRLRWERRGAKPPGRIGLAAFDFPDGTLLLTEASTKKRAALYAVRGAAALRAFDPGGIEVLECDLSSFREALIRERHTLKRVLTDPRVFSGIGNAYSDEILHAAGLSPIKQTHTLTEDEINRLFSATQVTLRRWIDILGQQFKERFPGAGDVTAFREGFAVHGRYRQPCPVCGTLVQRIRYAENETNYCPRCQTGGKLLADRSLSRLLKDDWPKSIEELEDLRGAFTRPAPAVGR
jgi:formamidopyrimidine-DNA glycosylase